MACRIILQLLTYRLQIILIKFTTEFIFEQKISFLTLKTIRIISISL